MMTIAEALEIGEGWHGIEPCDECGITHFPVWIHVNFDDDHPLGPALRSQRDALIAGDGTPGGVVELDAYLKANR